MQRSRTVLVGAVLALVLACKEEKAPEPLLAPTAAALSAAPRAVSAQAFSVEGSSSRFRFLMDSPLEKIEGDAPQSLSGELFVLPTDLAQSTALVKADLQQLTLYQQKRGDDKAAYGERTKSDLQNEHARGWLQIDAKAGEVTAEQAEANRFAELKLEKLTDLSANDVTQLSGSERKVLATATGDFRLHGRKAKKTAKLELTFKYDGDELTSVDVKTVEPFVIALEEFEVHPRDAAGKIVKRLSDALSSNLKGKVAKDAPVFVTFTAKRR